MKSNGINEERVDVIQLKASISKITRKEKKKDQTTTNPCDAPSQQPEKIVMFMHMRERGKF